MKTALNLTGRDLRPGMLIHDPKYYASTGGLFSVVVDIRYEGCALVLPYCWYPTKNCSYRIIRGNARVVVLADAEYKPIIVEL